MAETTNLWNSIFEFARGNTRSLEGGFFFYVTEKKNQLKT